MSTMEPEDDFIRTLEDQLSEALAEISLDVVDVTKIPDTEIGLAVKECDKLLSDMGQLHNMNPKSESARELHSRRAALLVEMARRGLR